MIHAAAAQQAVQYVKQKLTMGANNKPADIWSSRGSSLLCVASEKAAEMYLADEFAKMDRLEVIRSIAKMAENSKCGNCGEQASVAFIYLYDRGFRPLDLMQFENGNHGFIVIGRVEGAREVADWGPEAYIADPWLGKWYPATQLGSVWPGKRPALTYRAP